MESSSNNSPKGRTLSEAVWEVQQGRRSKRARVKKLAEEGWEPFDPSVSSLQYEGPDKVTSFLVLDISSGNSLADIFLKILTPY